MRIHAILILLCSLFFGMSVLVGVSEVNTELVVTLEVYTRFVSIILLVWFLGYLTGRSNEDR